MLLTVKHMLNLLFVGVSTETDDMPGIVKYWVRGRELSGVRGGDVSCHFYHDLAFSEIAPKI